MPTYAFTQKFDISPSSETEDGVIVLQIVCTSTLEKHMIQDLVIQVDFLRSGMTMSSSIPKIPEPVCPFKAVFKVAKALAPGESFRIFACFKRRRRDTTVSPMSQFQICGRFCSSDWHASDTCVTAYTENSTLCCRRITNVVHTEIYYYDAERLAEAVSATLDIPEAVASSKVEGCSDDDQATERSAEVTSDPLADSPENVC
jgi:hypothetical protein